MVSGLPGGSGTEDKMDADEMDSHLFRGRSGDPAVRFTRSEGDALLLWYGTFDAVLRLLYDLWWTHRRIGRLRLLSDWLADRGVFDPEPSLTTLDDSGATRDALVLARDLLARKSDFDDPIDSALVTLIRFLNAAIAAEEPIRVERIEIGFPSEDDPS
jgi:hypothetical protein